MGFRFSLFVTFLTLALVASHAALSPELYWKSVLPNTPMPKAVTDLLHPDLVEDKSTAVDVGKGGVNVDAGKGKPGGTSVNVGKGGVGVGVDTGKGKPGGTSVNVGKGGVDVGVDTGKGKPGGTSVNVGGGGKGGVDVNTGNHGKGTNVGVGKGGVNVNTGHKGKPVYVRVNPGSSPFNYLYAATENQLHDDRNTALFFVEKDLHPGTKMNLHFTENSNKATFLPRQVAKSIPFSSNKMPEILNRFSVKPGSLEAHLMQNTIKECEEAGIKGEEKYCATSLESMVDFSTSKLGKNVQATSTEVEQRTRLQVYTITAGIEKMTDNKSVVCHKQNYAYAVFYCHATQTTRAYTVPLEGTDGTKAKAVAGCHTDMIHQHGTQSIWLFNCSKSRCYQHGKQLCHMYVKFFFTNCFNLDQKAVSNVFEESLKGSEEPPIPYSIYLPGNKIPEWFTYQSPGSSINIRVLRQDLVNRKFMGFAICAVFGNQKHHCDPGFLSV